MGRKKLRDKAKKTWNDAKDKAKEVFNDAKDTIKEEYGRIEDDVKQAVRDDNDRAQKCLEIISNQGVAICNQATKKQLVAITDQKIGINHPNLDDCLKEFGKKAIYNVRQALQSFA